MSNKKLKVLELFSGKECMSNAFRRKGHQCFTVDWDKQFPSNLHMDVEELSTEMILEKFGKPDLIFSGSDCTTYSIAAVSKNRRLDENGVPQAITEYGKKCDNMNRHVRDLAKELDCELIIENPRAMMRKMDFVQDLIRNETTYCQYGFPYMKPTDFFATFDLHLKPPCKNGDPCHVRASRGSRSGLQGVKGKVLRSIYPEELCKHIVEECEKHFKEIEN